MQHDTAQHSGHGSRTMSHDDKQAAAGTTNMRLEADDAQGIRGMLDSSTADLSS
jgi:hypothetical protein